MRFPCLGLGIHLVSHGSLSLVCGLPEPKIDFYTMQISDFLDCWLWEMSDDLSIGCCECIMWPDYKGCGILLALAILTHYFEFDFEHGMVKICWLFYWQGILLII